MQLHSSHLQLGGNFTLLLIMDPSLKVLNIYISSWIKAAFCTLQEKKKKVFFVVVVLVVVFHFLKRSDIRADNSFSIPFHSSYIGGLD